MAQSIWEADKMLDIYIHDYLLKRKLHNSAKAFMTEGKVATDPVAILVAIDAPGGFLFEWWSVFWDIFIARTNNKHSEAAASYIEAQQTKLKEHHHLQVQQLQMLQQRNSQLRNPNQISVNGESVLGQNTATAMAMKMYEERMRNPPSVNEASPFHLLESTTSHPGPLPQGNVGNIPALQQLHERATAIKSEMKDGHYVYGEVKSAPNFPLKGWPLTGIEQLRPNMVQKANQTLFSVSSQCSEMDPRRLQQFRGNINAKQHSVSSPKPHDQNHIPPIRKRKPHSSPGPVGSAGNTPNSPPSTHTPGDVQNPNNLHKKIHVYGSDSAGCSNILEDDINNFGDIAPLDDNLDQFLSRDGRDLYGTLETSKDSFKRFSFSEFGCIRARNNKVTCCHFSSDGKVLASAGHDKKVVLWNMDTLQTESSTEEHKSIVTDIRFRPNSSQLATASVDHTVRLWDSAKVKYSLNTYTGNTAVMSLDFHPKKTDLFCFSNHDNEIRYWNTSPFSCKSVFKGGNTQVRFQPRTGHLLAAASDQTVTVFDVDTERQVHSFQGHPDILNYLCWNSTGDVLASVSQNLVKFWSLSSGECIHEFSSNGNQFHSCVFHPSYPSLLVIGGMSSLELWNIAQNKNMTIDAHDNIISALAQSPVTGMVASASHDASVKLWK